MRQTMGKAAACAVALATAACLHTAGAEEYELPKPPEYKPPKPPKPAKTPDLDEVPRTKSEDDFEMPEAKRYTQEELLKMMQPKTKESKADEKKKAQARKSGEDGIARAENGLGASEEAPEDRRTIEQRHAEARKEMEQRLAEARRAAEERLKKEENSGREKSGRNPNMIVSGSEGQPVMDLTAPGAKDRKKNTSQVIDPKKEEKRPTHYVLGGSGKDGGSPQVGTDGVVRYMPAGGPTSVENDAPDGEKKIKLADTAAPKRGFWDRLFGKDEPPPNMLPPSALKSGNSAAMVSNPAEEHNPDPSNGQSLLKRLEAEMAAKRLKQEAALRAQQEDGKELPPAAVVDLDQEKQDASRRAAGAEAGRRPVTPLDAPPKGMGGAAMPQQLSEAEMQQAVELRFERGVASRDYLEREWAYRYALIAGKAEAIPHLHKEIKTEGPLSAMAASVLSRLDPENPETVRMLLGTLASKDGNLRMSGIAALGRLRAQQAVRPLLQLLDNEKNYRVRKAICEALGGIGGKDAAERLKAVVANKDELEEIRNQAALSLTELGDHSGKERLVTGLASRDPGQQAAALLGLVQTGDPDIAGYLSAGLESPHPEVWTTAASYFPYLGHGQALPVLRPKLQSNNPDIRRRAALTLGILGIEDGLPYVDEAVRTGDLNERVMGITVLEGLKRRDRAPLLMEKLGDPQPAVRSSAAMALASLHATEALPALLEAARGALRNESLPPALRGNTPNYTEQLHLLDAIRILRGEKEVLEFNTQPNSRDQRWPEYEKQLFARQVDLVKGYQLRDVLGSPGKPMAAVLADPNGREFLCRQGEAVAAGFKVVELNAGETENGKVKHPAHVVVQRGDTRVLLFVGREAEVSQAKSNRR